MSDPNDLMVQPHSPGDLVQLKPAAWCNQGCSCFQIDFSADCCVTAMHKQEKWQCFGDLVQMSDCNPHPDCIAPHFKSTPLFSWSLNVYSYSKLQSMALSCNCCPLLYFVCGIDVVLLFCHFVFAGSLGHKLQGSW